ncbi:MAG: TonB-dependent receptor, partial [Sphingobacteriales bacterium]
MKNTVSALKLRASYGTVGNAEIGSYSSLNFLNSVPVYFDNREQSGVVLSSSIANPNLQWERQRTLDIGIDIAFLNNRIQLTADYYNKVNDDLLYSLPVAESTGFSSIYYNIGAIRNRGFELGINTVNISGKNFRWNTSANFSLNRSLVTKLPGGAIYGYGNRILEGRPLNEFYGYERIGVFQTDEAAQAYYGSTGRAGDVQYRDVDGNGVKNADGDRVPLGNAMPKWEANMTNTLSYKGLTFFLDLQGMYGHKLMNNTRRVLQNPLLKVNYFGNMLDSWTPQNPNTMLPAIGSNKTIEVADSYYAEDGSFLRVRNIGLSYRLKAEWLKKFIVKGLTIGANVENAFLFTGYTGYDPEYTSLDAKLNQGYDNYQYPKY